MPLYHQRRFAKLGYSATSIIGALDLLQMLLHETEKDNLFVQSCKLYMECKFFFNELKILSYFTHKVTLPLLNCLEMSSQKDLLQILPTLYHDLANGKMHTTGQTSFLLQAPTSSGNRQQTSERDFVSNVCGCSLCSEVTMW